MTNNGGEKFCIEFSDVEEAAKRIKGIAHRTPVLTCASMDRQASQDENGNLPSKGRRLFFKVEALQRTGSFKFRGAVNAVRSITQQQPADETSATPLQFVTHSSGNHAQALALAAKTANAHATIVMPRNTPAVKKAAVQDFGATIVMVDSTNEAREDKCEEIRQETNAIFVHPSEDPRVIAGQGTVCLELVQQMKELSTTEPPPELDIVIIPVGGGGLAAGNLISLRALLGNKVKIVLAEPSQLDDAYRSFQAGQLLKHAPDNKLDSCADGLKTTLGPNTWPIVRDCADQIITVDEIDILRATKFAWERLKVCIEPSAGVGLAVACYSPTFREHFPVEQYPNVGVVLCGGNVDVLKTAEKMKAMGIA